MFFKVGLLVVVALLPDSMQNPKHFCTNGFTCKNAASVCRMF